MSGERRRSWWGWGWEDQALAPDQVTKLAGAVAGRFGLADLEAQPAPDLGDLDLPRPRMTAPSALSHLATIDPHERAGHTYGKSYRDIVRALRGEVGGAPDLVLHPATEADVVAVLDWCTTDDVVVVPYGGGSSVVGGVEGARGAGDRPWVSLDLTRLDQVVEIDRTSRAARIQGGALGPVLEDQLRPHGLTLRHFPQSFEFSTLGGWLATRSGGHYATVWTHIEDLCESMRVVTPAGISESRRLPGSGAGPSPDRMFVGSEGTLGVITEAWMRLQDRPRWKASVGARFADYADAVTATRLISQSGLHPTNCRLLDTGEAMLSAGVGDGSSVLVLGFESADHPVEAWLDRAIEIVSDCGASLPEPATRTGPHDSPQRGDDGAVGAWRSAFLRMPYGRDAMARMSLIAETFETAVTWDRFDELHAGVTETVTKALHSICGDGFVTCRFTHVYPDGPAPYFSVLAPSSPGSELSQWDEIKSAVGDALLSHGGTITHHHAVGRDHRPHYDRQRPEPFADGLRAVKRTLDPAGILNPGVLIDP